MKLTLGSISSTSNNPLDHWRLFALFRSARTKAAHKTLVNLTPKNYSSMALERKMKNELLKKVQFFKKIRFLSIGGFSRP